MTPSPSSSDVQNRQTAWRTRVKPWLIENRWTIMLMLWAAAMALGYRGFAKYYGAQGIEKTPWDLIYLSLQLFTVESGSVPGHLSWELETARLLAPVATVYTAVQAVAVVFRDRVQRLRLRFFHHHIVICGLGRRGMLLAREFRARGDNVVVIEHDDDNDRIEPCRENGCIVLIGNAVDREVLSEAQAHRARHVITLCSNDGVNAEVAVTCRSLPRPKGLPPLTCIVQIVDAQLLNVMKAQDMRMGNNGSFRLEFFNAFDRGARAILQEHPPFRGGGDKGRGVLTIGLGRMGESLVVHMARGWRNGAASEREKLRLLLIDRHAKSRKEYLMLHYPLLSHLSELEALEMDVTSPEFYRADYLFDEAGNPAVSAIYICLDDDSRAMAAALALIDRTQAYDVPIVVRMTHQGGLAALVRGSDDLSPGLRNLHPFGVFDHTCSPELVLGGTHEMLARGIHEHLVRHASSFPEHFLPRGVELPWQDLHVSHRDAFRRQADQIGQKLIAARCSVVPLVDWDAAAFAFEPHQVELLAKMEHDYFVQERLNLRWTYFPGLERVAPRTQPLKLKWEERSAETQEQYREIIRGLPRFLAGVDFQICRFQ